MKRIVGSLLVAASAALVGACAGPRSGAGDASALARAQIEAIVASPDRSDADRRNDIRRKPVDLIAFTGARPGMTVLDVSAGGGYTTELLARAVGPGGRVYGQSAPRNPDRAPPAAPEAGAGAAAAPSASAPPPRTSATALAERAKKPAAANIVAVVQPF